MLFATFAEGAGQALLFFILCFSVITWRATTIARGIDKDGSIRGAARKAAAKGVASFIARKIR